jgi:cytidine deaminase
MIDWTQLRAAAQAVASRAYAPYSKFHVGAALLSDDGRIWSGCNVENASYGLSICAERNALFGAVAHGVRRFVACAVITSAKTPVTPCGACRQVLSEFGPSFEVRCYGSDGAELATTTRELLPHAFSEADLEKPRDDEPPP